MKVKTIIYQKSFVIGPYLQEKIGVEVEVDHDEHSVEDYNGVFLAAKTLVEQWHKENNPALYVEHNGSYYHMDHNNSINIIAPDRGTETVSDTPLAIIRDLNTCKNLKTLESYKFIAKQNPSIQEAYDKKYNELQNK